MGRVEVGGEGGGEERGGGLPTNLCTPSKTNHHTYLLTLTHVSLQRTCTDHTQNSQVTILRAPTMAQPMKKPSMCSHELYCQPPKSSA